jgi:hypothetical protein
MIFTYKSDPNEGVEALTASVRAVTPKWAGLPTYGLTILGVAALARITTHNWGEITGFTVFGLGILTLAAKLEQRLRWERAIEADPHSAENHSVEIGERGLAFSCEHARSDLAWSGVRRVVETPGHYLFVCGPFGACAVPKRIISDAEDDALRAIIREHSPDRGANLARELAPAAPAT